MNTLNGFDRPRTRVIDLSNVEKIYGQGDTTVRAVDGVDLVVETGDYVAIMGASGSGKSTLMNIIGCLDRPTRGTYLLDGLDIKRRREGDLSRVRNRKIGFVFQSFNLISRTSAVRNVELPLAYAGVAAIDRRSRAIDALDKVGLSGRVDHHPSQLSGGQQQRVAIARALVTEPVLLLADEPTGALDSHSTDEVLDLFDHLSKNGRTVVMITHEDQVAEHAKRVITMSDGRIVSDIRQAPVHGLPPMIGRQTVPSYRTTT